MNGLAQNRRSATAIAAALAYLVLLVAIQAGSVVVYLLPPGSRIDGAAGLLIDLPLLQSQNIAVCALFGFAVWLLVGFRGGGSLSLVLLAGLALFSLGDQVYYKVFLDHVHLSLFEDGAGFNPSLLMSSFARERDVVFWSAVAIALAGILGFACMLVARPAVPRLAVRIALGFGLLLFLVGIPNFYAGKYFNINQNPVWSFVQDWQRSDLRAAVGNSRGSSSSRNLSSLSTETAPDRDPRLSSLAAARAARGGRPNVILVLLESVGERDLFDDSGRISPIVAPVLAGLSAHGILYDSIYTSFPASVRAVVSLETGGRDVGFGGRRELTARFTGTAFPGAFRDAGYSAAFISSQRLDGEFMDSFLGNLGFDYLFDFARQPPDVQATHAIHSWGAQEDYTLGILEQWIGRYAAGGPFLLEYYTAATHHPYGVPKGFPPIEPPGDVYHDYVNALHYTDHALGELVEFLRQRGLADNTVIAVTGDHGEAFGRYHPANRIHREFIYEENVRDFLLLSDPAIIHGPVVSHRLGSNGDILPTLLAWATGRSLPQQSVSGRNLTADTVQPVPVYFYKFASPEKWGLRNGRWKYIGDMRDDYGELYDLASDPDEKHDLSLDYPDLVARYRLMCQRWITGKTAEYRMLTSP